MAHFKINGSTLHSILTLLDAVLDMPFEDLIGDYFDVDETYDLLDDIERVARFRRNIKPSIVPVSWHLVDQSYANTLRTSNFDPKLPSGRYGGTLGFTKPQAHA